MTTGEQTAEVPRKRIPQVMWNQIRVLEAARASCEESARGNLRAQLISLGETHGLTEGDLIRRGLITPPRKPAEAPLKGGH